MAESGSRPCPRCNARDVVKREVTLAEQLQLWAYACKACGHLEFQAESISGAWQTAEGFPEGTRAPKPTRELPHQVMLLHLAEGSREAVEKILSAAGAKLAEGLPAVVVDQIPRAKAREIVQELLANGAVAQVKPCV